MNTQDGFTPALPSIPFLPCLRGFVLYRRVLDAARIAYALELTGDLRDQIVRASTSAVLNVAEGSGQPTVPAQRKYWGYARGSVREVAAATDLAAIRLGDREDIRTLAGLLFEADRILRKLLA